MLRLMPLLLMLLALPALATEPAAAPVDATPTTSSAEGKAKRDRRKAAECGQTGTRIKGGNRTQSVRCYGRNDLDRTGSTDLGEALRRLDPTIR